MPRVVDAELDALWDVPGAVLVEGAKAAGKTAAASHVSLDVDDRPPLTGADPALLVATALN